MHYELWVKDLRVLASSLWLSLDNSGAFWLFLALSGAFWLSSAHKVLVRLATSELCSSALSSSESEALISLLVLRDMQTSETPEVTIRSWSSRVPQPSFFYIKINENKSNGKINLQNIWTVLKTSKLFRICHSLTHFYLWCDLFSLVIIQQELAIRSCWVTQARVRSCRICGSPPTQVVLGATC